MRGNHFAYAATQSWAFKSSAPRRPEELAETHEGVVTYNVIAGKRRGGYLVYKVNVHAKLIWR